MNTTTLGDLGQGYLLRNRTSAIKQQMQKLGDELATGRISDVRGSMAGNYSFLTDVERKTTVLATYKIATSEATQFAGAMQLSLGNFSAMSLELSTTLLSAGSSASGASVFDVAAEARATLDGMMASLNNSFAGRSLFSGNATDVPPLVDSDTLMADLTAAVAGATTPADLMTAAEAWFADPAGFDALTYQGSTIALSSFSLSVTEEVSIDVRADHPGLKRAMRGAAVAALANNPGLGFTRGQKAELFDLIGRDMLIGQDDVIELQSDVGLAEARIDRIAVRNAAEMTSLNLARNTLLEADSFETATKLEEVQFQLQSLYAVTVRMSQLSLVNYL